MTLIYFQVSFNLKNSILHIFNKNSKKSLVHKKITLKQITLMTCGKCALECWTIWRVAECFILTRIICSVAGTHGWRGRAAGRSGVGARARGCTPTRGSPCSRWEGFSEETARATFPSFLRPVSLAPPLNTDTPESFLSRQTL